MKKLLKQLLNVKNVKIKSAEIRTDARNEQYVVIGVEQTKGQNCCCPLCGRKAKPYDRRTVIRYWRALDFGTTKVYIKSNAPRIRCEKHGVHTQKVSWARHHSNFTRDFENTVAWMSKNLSKSAVAEYMRIQWNTVGPIISRFKTDADPEPKHRFSGLKRIGIDETSYRKGHKYMTVVVNHDDGRIVWIHEKHGKDVLRLFLEELTEEQRTSIECYSADGARWISETMAEYCPKAQRCLDSFHMIEWLNDALDKVRIDSWQEAKKKVVDKKRGRGRPHKGEEKDRSASVVKGSSYVLGKAPENLSLKQKIELDNIARTNPKLYRAYCLKENLRKMIKLPAEEMDDALKDWLWKASHSRIPAIYEVQKKIRRHRQAILNTAKYRLSNARIEATNNKIKLSIRMAYGFRNMDNMMDLIMLRCSDICVKLPGRCA